MRSERYHRSAKRRPYKRNVHPHQLSRVLGTAALIVFGLLIFVAVQTAHAAPNSGARQMSPPGTHSGMSGLRVLKPDGSPIRASDVEHYVMTVGMPRTLGPRNPITDVHAELLTSAQISARLHDESTGYPASAQLWFVQMHGTFVFPGPPDGKSVTAHIGYQFFDPVSGNLLMFGGIA